MVARQQRQPDDADGVVVVDDGPVRVITIDRPARRNAVDSRAAAALLSAFGRGIDGVEAERIGLANRVTPPGTALPTAITLARELASLPQTCTRNDRRSAIEQWHLDLDAATRNEAQRGRATIESGETAAGAQRFRAGAGRHGAVADRSPG